MKKITLTIFTCAICFMLNAQNFDWARRMGSSGSDYANGIAIDSEGFIYTCGTFDSPTDFDPSSNVFTLTPDGTDAFVQKMDRHGNFVWAFKIGGTATSGAEFARGIAIDNAGNVLVTGDFMYTVDFDPSTTINNITSQGNYDFFASKYDSNGNLLWVKTIGGTIDDNATCIDFDSNNNVLIGGYFQSVADFNPGAGTTTFAAIGRDGFVLKLDVNGDFVWAKQFGPSNNQYVHSLNVDLNDDVEIVGYFTTLMDADPNAGVVNLPGNAAYDAFIVKLNSAGNYQWSGGLYGSGNEVAYDVTSDNLGNVIYTGYFASSSLDGDPSAGTTVLTNGGGLDAFIIKFSSIGAFVWGFSIGAGGNDNGYSINTNSLNQIYLSGYFYSTTDFDPSASVSTLSTIGLTDLFIAKYDATSTLLWAKTAGGIFDDIPRATAVDAYENVVTTGWFDGTADLNPDAGTYNLTTAGVTDVFVMKLKTCSVTMSAMAANFCDSYVSPSGLYTWTNSGVYNDTLLNATGCDSVLTITLTKLIVDISTSVSGLTMTSNAGAATNYQWFNCNTNLPISGATSQNYNAVVNGDYSVIVTMNGCVDTSSCININNVGINENSLFQNILIYPNPTNSDLYIVNEIGDNVSIQLLDVTGKLVIQINSAENPIKLDVSEVEVGMYFLKLESDRDSFIQKVIKE